MRKLKVISAATPNADYLKFVIANSEKNDYELVHEYNRMGEAAEIVKRNSEGTLQDYPKPYKFKDGFIYFGLKKIMIHNYKAEVLPSGKVALYELTFKAYDKLERAYTESLR